MSYIVRVVGYNAYWTGDLEPGKCWSTNIADSQLFDTLEETQVIVNSGINMEAVEYNFAISDNHQDVFDWDEIDRKVAEIEENKKNRRSMPHIVELGDFETFTNDEVQEVDVEVLD